MRFASETRPTRPRRPGLRSSTGSAVESARASASPCPLAVGRSRAHFSGVIPCALSSMTIPRRRFCFVVVDLLTMRCLSGRDDAFALTPLDETNGQENVPDETCNQLPVLVRLVENETIDRVQILQTSRRAGARSAWPSDHSIRIHHHALYTGMPY